VATMPRNIEETFEDVLSLTNQDLLLNNSSRPHVWKSEERFIEFVKGMTKKAGIELEEDDIPRAMINEDDLIIHLNPIDVDWHGPIIGYYQPLCVFLERTIMGRELRESGKKNILYDKKCYFLDGFGRFVEEKTIERLSERGYKLDVVKYELSKELKSAPYYKDVKKILNQKWKESYDARNDLDKLFLDKLLYGSKKPNYKEIIAALILASSSDSTKDFNKTFLELENMTIPDIFVKSGSYGKIVENELIPREEADAIRSCVLNLMAYIGDEKQIRDIKPLLKEAEEQLSQLGKDYDLNPLDSLGKRASELYKMIDPQPTKLRIEEMPDSKTYLMLFQTLLDDTEMWINRYSKGGFNDTV